MTAIAERPENAATIVICEPDEAIVKVVDLTGFMAFEHIVIAHKPWIDMFG